MAEGNTFSPHWFERFLDTKPLEETEREVDFVVRHLPPDVFPTVLDVACGPGRHLALLVAEGYRVTGIDDAPAAVDAARSLELPDADIHELDMRRLDRLETRFDGVLNLWHSFGYFDDATNATVLRAMHDRLRPRGRCILDLYHREALARLPATRRVEAGGIEAQIDHAWDDTRLDVTIAWADGRAPDRFRWRLYTPAEMIEMAEAAGFGCALACAWFDESTAPSPEHTRMQLVLDRP